MRKEILISLILCSTAWGVYTPDNDCNCAAWLRFEAGSLNVDETGNYAWTQQGTVTSDGNDYQEGAYASYNLDTGDFITDAAITGGPWPGTSSAAVDEMTVCAWVKFAQWHGFAGEDIVYYTGRYYLSVGSAQATCAVYTGSSWESDIMATPLNTDIWYHIAFTYDNSDYSYRLRVWDANASEFVEADVTGNFTEAQVYTTPQTPSVQSGDFDGRMDDLLVFNRVLTTDEIDAIRQQTFEGVPCEAPPTGQIWSVWENSIQWLTDWKTDLRW